MHSLGKSYSTTIAITILASSFLLSTAAQAAPSCSSFLIKSEEEVAELNPIETIQEDINQAQTLEEANRLTYELVTFSNNLFDQVIDGIIALNTKPPEDQQAAQQQARQVQGLIEALQNAFKIPSYVMNFAIANRLEIESAEAMQKQRAEQRREAIGFIRTELSKEFHADQPAKQPIGFVLKGRKNKNGNAFFNMLIEQINADAVKARKDAAEKEAAEAPKAPIGFVPPKDDAAVEDSAPLNNVGFVQTEEPTKTFRKSEVHQVVINVQTGEFRVVEEAVKQPIGF